MKLTASNLEYIREPYTHSYITIYEVYIQLESLSLEAPSVKENSHNLMCQHTYHYNDTDKPKNL